MTLLDASLTFLLTSRPSLLHQIRLLTSATAYLTWPDLI